MANARARSLILTAVLASAALGCTSEAPLGPDGDAGGGGGSDAGGGGESRGDARAPVDGGAVDGRSADGGDGAPPARDGGVGNVTGCPEADEGGVLLAAGTALARAIVPNPIASLNKKVTTTTQNHDASQVFRDPANPALNYDLMWHPSAGESVTIEIGAGFDELLMVWEIGYPDYTSADGKPLYDYQIDVSADGATWTSAVARTTSYHKSREAKFSFTGQTRVRFTVPASSNAYFATMKLFDASNGTDDTWLIAGTGPSRFVYDDLVAPGFGHLVNTCRPKYYPAMLNIADGPGKITDLLDALNAAPESNWLALNPDFHFWVLNYGMTDTQGSQVGDFASGLESAIQRLIAAGKAPIVPHIQYVTPNNGSHFDLAVIAQYNAAIDQLVAKYKLLPAPDPYAWFEAHPGELCTSADDANDPSHFCGESQWDGIQPINVPSRPGVSDTIRLWAAAAIAGGVYAN